MGIKKILIDITGQKFGRLTVINQDGISKWGDARWLCKCDCGEEKVIAGKSLRGGYTKSCGCLRREITGNKNKLIPGLASMKNKMALYKRSAKNRGLKWNLNEEQFKKITQKDCYYCGAKPNNISGKKKYNGEYIYNGIDRVDNNKGYTIDNIVPCCRRCNTAKSNFTLQEFQDWIKRIYKKQIKNERR